MRVILLSLVSSLLAYDATKLCCLVNAERAKAGASPLALSSKLNEAAQQHSEDMARRRSMDHTGSNGSQMDDRLRRNGYSFKACAENIAAGQRSEDEVMDSWMNSSGHRTNIMNTKYTHFGAGMSSNYWTQDFASGETDGAVPDCSSYGGSSYSSPKQTGTKSTKPSKSTKHSKSKSTPKSKTYSYSYGGRGHKKNGHQHSFIKDSKLGGLMDWMNDRLNDY